MRAIRSYIGANSGTFTQRDDIFYERRQDTFTYLRVHAGISQVSQYLDYSPAATGMIYTNSSVYPASATIDGVPDAAIPVPAGNALQTPEAEWEQANGPQGSLSVITRVEQNVPGFTPGYFYRDQGDGPSTSTSAAATLTPSPTDRAAASSRAAAPTPTRRSEQHYDLTASARSTTTPRSPTSPPGRRTRRGAPSRSTTRWRRESSAPARRRRDCASAEGPPPRHRVRPDSGPGSRFRSATRRRGRPRDRALPGDRAPARRPVAAADDTSSGSAPAASGADGLRQSRRAGSAAARSGSGSGSSPPPSPRGTATAAPGGRPKR